MRARLFWNLGLIYLALLFASLLAVDLYSSRALEHESLRAADERLVSLLDLARAHPPNWSNNAEVSAWSNWLAQSGARVSVIDGDGRVLADSALDSRLMEDHSDRPEFQQALSAGQGQSVRHSASLNQDLIYHAVRLQRAASGPVVIRMSLPLAQVNSSLLNLHRQLLSASLVILFVAALLSFVFFRQVSGRIQRLKDFSIGLSHGDFHPLAPKGPPDELSDLAEALNQAAAWMDQTIHSLSGERNRSSAILRSMVEGVAVIDAHERVVFSNRAFSEILNLDPSSIEARPLLEVVRNSELLGLIRLALLGEEGLQADIAMGFVQQRSFSVTAAPVKSLEASSSAPAAGQRVSGAVVVLHDVTELRRLERVRQDFVANVSHEFKTPLTAIQGFTETLLAGALNDPGNNRRFLEIVRDHAVRLARLTDDLLKLARIEAGKLELEFFPVRPIELIERCAETTLLKASQKQIALEIDVPPDLPAVRGDANLLRDVLQNLLDNAIQYTSPGGRIRVEATFSSRGAIIAVEDTGIGIPLADQERIFERFYRVDAARSREAGGTGLGLSIAKHIIETHGGRLWVESEVGRGSKFFFSLPPAG